MLQNGYLIGPIDQATPKDQTWKAILDRAIRLARDNRNINQITLYDPAAPWLLNGNYTHNRPRRAFIELVNKAAMENADFAIANLPKSTFSFGSCVEVDYFACHSKPIILVTDIPYETNIYMANRVPKDMYITYQPGTEPLQYVDDILDRIHTFHGISKDDSIIGYRTHSDMISKER